MMKDKKRKAGFYEKGDFWKKKQKMLMLTEGDAEENRTKGGQSRVAGTLESLESNLGFDFISAVMAFSNTATLTPRSIAGSTTDRKKSHPICNAGPVIQHVLTRHSGRHRSSSLAHHIPSPSVTTISKSRRTEALCRLAAPISMSGIFHHSVAWCVKKLPSKTPSGTQSPNKISHRGHTKNYNLKCKINQAVK